MNQIKRLHDQHLHTKYSLDSKEEIVNYYQLASSIECSYFVTTDHIEFDSVFNNQDWTVDFESLKNDLFVLNKQYPNVTPLLGVEIGYRKDHIDDMIQLINSQNFDLINMSIHDNGVYDYYMKKDYLEVGIDKMLDIYFNNIIDGVHTFKNYDVLSHVDYGFKTAYTLDSTLKIEKYESYLKEIFEVIVQDDKVLEINFKVQDTINDIEHLKTLLKMYKKYGGKKLSFSSDAHFYNQLNNYYLEQDKYFQLIKDCGFDKLCYFVNRKQCEFKI